MKRFCGFLVMSFVLISFMTVLCCAQEAPKENVAIIATKAVEDDWGTMTTGEGYLIDLFLKMKRFNVIERSRLQSILQEQKMQMSGLVDEVTAVKVGNLAGAKYLVMYTVTSVPQPFGMGGGQVPAPNIPGAAVPAGNPYAGANMGMRMKFMMGSPAISINTRIISVQDSKIIYNKMASRESQPPKNKEEENKQRMDAESIVNKFTKDIMENEIGPDLLEKFPVRGYIIDVRPDRTVEIDLGQDIGINEGMEITVIEIGPDRKHPVTGKIIPGKTREIARLKVKKVEGPESSICEITGPETLAVGQTVEVVPLQVK